MAKRLQGRRLVELLEEGAEAPPEAHLDGVTRILKAIRGHLGMDVAFASEVADGQVVIRHLDSEPEGPIHVGQAFAAEESYCQRIIDGRLPSLLPDTAANDEAASLAVTKGVPVGAHLSVPVRLGDGRIYGTFCCFSHKADRSLNERDLAMLRAFAELAAAEIDQRIADNSDRAMLVSEIKDMIARDRMRMVYQPIYSLDDDSIVGVEALARFPDCELRPPSEWFRAAATVDLGQELELHALGKAIATLAYLPEPLYVAANVSPATVLSPSFSPLFEHVDAHRFVIEVTENEEIGDYAAFGRALEPLRRRARLAIDDVGAGYSAMRHILDLAPDIIKLDMSLVRDIDTDPARRSLALALVSFASGIDSQIVAEGVESAQELAVLRELGVPRAQGYYLGRPMPLMAFLQFLHGARQNHMDPAPPLPRRAFP